MAKVYHVELGEEERTNFVNRFMNNHQPSSIYLGEFSIMMLNS